MSRVQPHRNDIDRAARRSARPPRLKPSDATGRSSAPPWDRWRAASGDVTAAVGWLGRGVLDWGRRATDRTVWAWQRLAGSRFERRRTVGEDEAYGGTGWSGSRAGRRRVAVVVATVAALLGSALVVVMIDAFQPDVEGATPTTIEEEGAQVVDADLPSPVPPVAESQLPEVEVHVSERGGYLFSYPAGWQIHQRGGIDRLVDPSGQVFMDFDVAPSGALRSASDQVVEDITARYDDVELVRGAVERTPQGLPSLVVGGRAVDPAGATVRFLVITIHDATGGNHAITVRFSADADPPDALPVIREVVASYRVSTAA